MRKNVTRLISLGILQDKKTITQVNDVCITKSKYRLSLPNPSSSDLITSYSSTVIPQKSRSNNGFGHLTISQAMEEFGLNRRKLQELCRKKNIKAEKRSGIWYIELYSLELWIAQNH